MTNLNLEEERGLVVNQNLDLEEERGLAVYQNANEHVGA
jgi:hypothetical protein